MTNAFYKNWMLSVNDFLRSLAELTNLTSITWKRNSNGTFGPSACFDFRRPPGTAESGSSECHNCLISCYNCSPASTWGCAKGLRLSPSNNAFRPDSSENNGISAFFIGPVNWHERCTASSSDQNEMRIVECWLQPVHDCFDVSQPCLRFSGRICQSIQLKERF